MFKKQINMLRKQILQNLVDDLVSPERVRFENLGKFAPGSFSRYDSPMVERIPG